MLIGSGRDSTPLPCLRMCRKETFQIPLRSYVSTSSFLLSFLQAVFRHRVNVLRTTFQHDYKIPEKTSSPIFPPTSFLYFFPLPFVFANSLIFGQPSTIWNTYCFSLSAGSYEALWLRFIKVVLSWRIKAIGNSRPSCFV